MRKAAKPFAGAGGLEVSQDGLDQTGGHANSMAAFLLESRALFDNDAFDIGAYAWGLAIVRLAERVSVLPGLSMIATRPHAAARSGRH